MVAFNRSLYIHWPYCQVKCPYCDFNVHLTKAQVDEQVWLKALLRDLDQQLEGLALPALETLYFGGGTPSLLSPHTLAALINGVAKRWGFAGDIDISLEVHPTSADAAKFADFRKAGANRASLGVQSFDVDDLAFLGRNHSREEAIQAVQTARRHFDKLSLDLMAALPGHSLVHQQDQIAQALDLQVDHLSLYHLSIEPGTAFAAAVRRGDWQPMEADQAADFYEAAVEQVARAGFVHYEVSNFAKPGFESRHSLLGWQGQGYVGIGPGAEGRVFKNDTWYHRRTRRNPKAYLETPLEIDAPLPTEERLIEQLIFGLRLTKGLPKEAPAWVLTQPERIETLIKHGDLAHTDGHLHATAQGRLRLDALSDYLINYER